MSGGGRGGVLLTGATGFVGMELLARYLERSDRRVVTLVRAASDGRLARGSTASSRTCSGLEVGSTRAESSPLRATCSRRGSGWNRLAPRSSRGEVEHDRSRRGLGVVHAAAGRGASDQPRGHQADARLCGALYERGEHSSATATCRPRTSPELTAVASPNATSTSGSGFGTRTSSRSSRPNNSCAHARGCRSRSCARASSSATGAAAGPRRSTCSTGRCGHLPGDCSRPCQRSRRHLSTSCRSTTWPTRSTPSVKTVARWARPTTLPRGRTRARSARSPSLASRYFGRPVPKVLTPAEFAALDGDGSPLERSGLESGRAYFPYFSIGTVFDEAIARARLDPIGIQVSPLGDYLERLLDFATRSRWGKRPIARAEALVT